MALDHQTAKLNVDTYTSQNVLRLTYSNNLLVTLATRDVPVVLCGPNHRPAALKAFPVV